MDTEKQNTIKEIRKVLNEINPKIPRYKIGSPEREKLEQSAAELEAVVWKLANEDLKQAVGELKDCKTKIKDIADELKNADEELKKIGDKVEKVSEVFSVLVNIASTTSSSGII